MQNDQNPLARLLATARIVPANIVPSRFSQQANTRSARDPIAQVHDNRDRATRAIDDPDYNAGEFDNPSIFDARWGFGVDPDY